MKDQKSASQKSRLPRALSSRCGRRASSSLAWWSRSGDGRSPALRSPALFGDGPAGSGGRADLPRRGVHRSPPDLPEGSRRPVPERNQALLKPDGPRSGRCLRRPYPNPFDPEEGKWGYLSPGSTVFRPMRRGTSSRWTQGPPARRCLRRRSRAHQSDVSRGSHGRPARNPGQSGFPGATGMPGGPAQMGQILPFKFGWQEGQPYLGVYAPQKIKAFKDYLNRRNINEWAFSPLVIQPKGVQRPANRANPASLEFLGLGTRGTPVVPARGNSEVRWVRNR